jgi:hypothetical protein
MAIGFFLLPFVGSVLAEHIPFRHVIVDGENPADPHCKAAGDIDGDGYPDLLAASASGGGLYWYRYPHWTKHRIAEGSFTTDMTVADIDGDGHLDVVIPGSAGLLWFRNPRANGGDPANSPWPSTNISPEGANMHDVEAADIDGDGRIDIVTRHQSGFGKRLGNRIHLWRQNAPERWSHRAFDCPHGEGLILADIQGDGRPDVVIGGRWYENPGDVLQGEWREHFYIPPERFATQWTNGDIVVQVADINGDGRPDIVLSPSEGAGRLSWFEAPPDPRQPDWTEHVIEPKIDHAHGLGLADMDGDGHPDIVVAKMHQASAPQEVCVYRNEGKGKAWSKQVVSSRGSHNIVVVDIGRKGKPSIFGANWNNNSPTKGALELWINER